MEDYFLHKLEDDLNSMNNNMLSRFEEALREKLIDVLEERGYNFKDEKEFYEFIKLRVTKYVAPYSDFYNNQEIAIYKLDKEETLFETMQQTKINFKESKVISTVTYTIR